MSLYECQFALLSEEFYITMYVYYYIYHSMYNIYSTQKRAIFKIV